MIRTGQLNLRPELIYIRVGDTVRPSQNKINNRESNLCLLVLCACLFDTMETVDKKHSGKAMPGKRSKGRPGIFFTVQIYFKNILCVWVNFACKSQAAYRMCAWYLKRPEVGVGSSGKLVLLIAKSLLGAGY